MSTYLCIGLHSVCIISHCCLSLLALAGSQKVLEKHLDVPGKSWNFLSVKVCEPCIKKWQKFLHICWGLWAADDFALWTSYWGSALIIILFVDVTGYSHFEAPCCCTSVIHFCSQAIKLMLFSSFWTGQLECDSLKYYTSVWAVSGFSKTTPKLCLVWPMPEIH